MSQCNKQMEFETFWPEDFYGSLNSEVIMMKSNKNSVKFGKNTVFDTQPISGRIIGLMLTRSVDMKDIMSNELSPVPTFIFGDAGEMRIATTKSTHENKLHVTHSARTVTEPGVIVVDG